MLVSSCCCVCLNRLIISWLIFFVSLDSDGCEAYGYLDGEKVVILSEDTFLLFNAVLITRCGSLIITVAF